MNTGLPFASHQSFLDPPLTSDGKPYGPVRYKELVRECVFISKNTNITYAEVLKLTPTERLYIEDIIKAEQKEASKLAESMQRKEQV